ncbi:O-succinylbenzoate synthase [Catalinimonas alkaloidigena]|uniref:o-succinylbenzoate synthase n=1 Tax=Catalinimonas alkaloidigena TaxID=1075417 RepID=UPI0024068EB0|nr:o-succinylbenzoate synthase [Catalinimonas alkaloidigena]MDF9797304.1 O-succinylbenzoate synthase [Catalinimonas alkaloidigena]
MISTFQKYTLNFKFLAGTSRGVLKYKDSFFIKVSQAYPAKVYGIGECAPLQGLSQDDRNDMEQILSRVCQLLNNSDLSLESEDEILHWIDKNIAINLPSVRFGVETALLDLKNGGTRQVLPNSWSQAPFQPIEINGLVWMGEKDWMLEQLKAKVASGFTCIKIKIGAIDFKKEMELLAYIRKHYDANQITIRVDANGAFTEDDVYPKLQRLSVFDVHSIEQPVKPGQHDLMRQLSIQCPVAIALDEELIGKNSLEDKTDVLDKINPAYIILKPTLLGGIAATKEWINLAEKRNIGWWITSALESNIGLNAIAQLCATYHTIIPQGLGTGQLYHNNIQSPLRINQGHLYYDQNEAWDLKVVEA